MQLSRTERWILANQYRILEKLSRDKEEAQAYSEGREALEWGYELHYPSLAEHILEETLSCEECAEVKDILFMYSTLQAASEVIAEVSLIDEELLVFPGFLANTETRQWIYARYRCGRAAGTKLRARSEDLQSFVPMLDRYRKMLREWKKADPGKLTREDVNRILAAGDIPPLRKGEG